MREDAPGRSSSPSCSLQRREEAVLGCRHQAVPSPWGLLPPPLLSLNREGSGLNDEG